jgi:endonuclease YncB( thermonuclease family)
MNDCEPVTRLLRTMHPVSKAHCIKSYAGRIFSLFTFAFSLSVLSASAASFTGPVVSVLEGDTLEVLYDGKAERIRLNGIDCPEKGQAYGNAPSTPPQSWCSVRL